MPRQVRRSAERGLLFAGGFEILDVLRQELGRRDRMRVPPGNRRQPRMRGDCRFSLLSVRCARDQSAVIATLRVRAFSSNSG